ncbi:hypothetical protein [Microtetraspora malaysiensis]|uniref:hypothetical protein n=1 Tax=Microtetraspora malaysiensis TaxID=161358 RepID=UPI003D8BD109
MSWRDALRPIRMERVAIAAPVDSLPEVLAEVADAGAVELATPPDASAETVAKAAVVRDGVAALAGWMPAEAVAELSKRLAPRAAPPSRSPGRGGSRRRPCSGRGACAAPCPRSSPRTGRCRTPTSTPRRSRRARTS